MEFHTFGDKNNKAVVLIHGVLTPWQIWEQHIDVLKESYYVIVPALDGHIEEHESEFISVENEAQQIETYIQNQQIGTVFSLCGLSMGGVIAYKIFERNNFHIENLVLDGAPLVKMPFIAEKVMTSAYRSIIHKSKKRDIKTLENFKRDFIPERYLESYLRFADTMSDTTVRNMLHSVCAGEFTPTENTFKTRILYMHGTKGNEVYSQKSARKMKKYYPEIEIKCFDGYKHAELAVYEPDKWLDSVIMLLKKKQNKEK